MTTDKLLPRAADHAFFNKLAVKLLKSLEKSDCSVDVLFLDNASLRDLKKRYKKKEAKYVNVLAFPAGTDFPHPDKEGKHLGEIYINARMAKKDSPMGVKMLVHGLAHLLGHDHMNAKEEKEMLEMEKKLLRVAK